VSASPGHRRASCWASPCRPGPACWRALAWRAAPCCCPRGSFRAEVPRKPTDATRLAVPRFGDLARSALEPSRLDLHRLHRHLEEVVGGGAFALRVEQGHGIWRWPTAFDRCQGTGEDLPLGGRGHLVRYPPLLQVVRCREIVQGLLLARNLPAKWPSCPSGPLWAHCLGRLAAPRSMGPGTCKWTSNGMPSRPAPPASAVR
jgi:hypothetical protein